MFEAPDTLQVVAKIHSAGSKSKSYFQTKKDNPPILWEFLWIWGFVNEAPDLLNDLPIYLKLSIDV